MTETEINNAIIKLFGIDVEPSKDIFLETVTIHCTPDDYPRITAVYANINLNTDDQKIFKTFILKEEKDIL